MATFETLLGLVALCAGLAALAQRLGIPIAVALVIGGMGVALIPGLPTVELDPELALALFLPPLLQISAYRTDWPAFKNDLRPILLLALGAVFFTAIAVAVVAYLIVPGLPWWAAIALGAIVAPPDAVAAASVLKRFNLPKRIVVILEGESLINDASSLVLYRFAVAAVTGGTVSYAGGVVQFVGMAVGGALVGWLVGRATMVVLTIIDDTLLDITVSILAGFAAYLGAEAVHASGVLAVVACGLMLGRKQHAEFTARTRLELNAVWNFIEFLLASLVFMLIGLQLRGLVERLASFRVADLGLLALAVSSTLIVSRFVWVFGSAWVPLVLSRRLREAEPMPPASHLTVMSWAGMRGVVSMAAALALPTQFPGRDIIVFLAFCAILVTLVLQGTTLSWLVRWLDVSQPEALAPPPEEALARAEVANAALAAIQDGLGADEKNVHQAAAGALFAEYEARAERANASSPQTDSDQVESQQRLRLAAIKAAREKLSQHMDQVDAEKHRAITEELDLEEQQIRSALGSKEGGLST